MRISLPDIRSILAIPTIYRLFSNLIGGDARCLYVDKHIRPRYGDKILDIGCGSADILSYLPSVEYVGLDSSQAYINSAKKRFGNRGTFLTKKVSKNAINEVSFFDIVLAGGVLHHLDDNEALQLFELARSALKKGGRLITLDGCYTEEQSLTARFLLSIDRGRYLRTKDQYLCLASEAFTDIKVSIYHDLIRIPYTHIIMECKA